MSGIDKIIARLNTDAGKQRDEIIRSAEQRREKIISDARNNAQEQARTMIAEAEKQAEYSVRIAASQADMQKRQASLTAKVAVINKCVQTALDRLNDLPASEFYAVMKHLILTQASDEAGVIAMLPDDAKSVPEDFLSDINTQTGGDLSITSDPSIGGRGAILRYGDIDINLTFASIIEADIEEIKQLVQSVLFPAEVRA